MYLAPESIQRRTGYLYNTAFSISMYHILYNNCSFVGLWLKRFTTWKTVLTRAWGAMERAQ